MLMYELLDKKKNGKPLSAEEIEFWVKGCLNGTIPDYQSAAMLMAGRINGFDINETAALVKAMTESGDRMDLSSIPGVKVDKHSTGGVGDKVSPVLMPLVAACGLKAAKMSGNGIGHTGGTLDKLAAIPGFRCQLSDKEFIGQVKDIGIAIISQSANLAPADKILYGLRDATATVDSIPLIVSSILSKKLATGADVLVFDVKYGSGAVFPDIAKSRLLAEALVATAAAAGKKAAAVLSSMEQPLGFAIGNALEIKEAWDVLNGGRVDDLRQVVLELASQMLLLSGVAAEHAEAWLMAEEKLDSGAAKERFLMMVKAQGGGIFSPQALPAAKCIETYTAPQGGYVYAINAREIGMASLISGAGRSKITDIPDPAAGVILRAKVGYRVEPGQPLAEIHCADGSKASDAKKILAKAFDIRDTAPVRGQLIDEIIKSRF